jgi:putative hydrolase of the HAD superfamily
MRGTDPVWFVDLDNTLHDASKRIFSALDSTITAFIADELGLSHADANELRIEYWRRYGATLSGLVRHHGVKVQHYVDRTHAFIDEGVVTDWVTVGSGLDRALSMLPGRKILLTNAPRRYASRVLLALGLERAFTKCIPIEEMHLHGTLRPKPSRALLRAVAARERVSAENAILVEDSVANLKAARAIGWRTVFVSGFLAPRAKVRINRPAYVDLQVKSIAQLALRYRGLF